MNVFLCHKCPKHKPSGGILICCSRVRRFSDSSKNITPKKADLCAKFNPANSRTNNTLFRSINHETVMAGYHLYMRVEYRELFFANICQKHKLQFYAIKYVIFILLILPTKWRSDEEKKKKEKKKNKKTNKGKMKFDILVLFLHQQWQV